jgi:hypothetical protein
LIPEHWAHSYEGDFADVIRMQNDVAGSVTDSIKAALQPAARKRLSTPQRPVSPDAYDAYLKGLYFSAKLTPPDIEKSFGYFQKAIAADPTFAPAYGGLSRSLLLGDWCGIHDTAGSITQGGGGRKQSSGDRSRPCNGPSLSRLGALCP